MLVQTFIYWAIGLAVVLEVISVYHVVRREIDEAGHFFIGLGQVASLMFVFMCYASAWYAKMAPVDISADSFFALMLLFGLVSIITVLYVVKRTLYSLLQRYF